MSNPSRLSPIYSDKNDVVSIAVVVLASVWLFFSMDALDWLSSTIVRRSKRYRYRRRPKRVILVRHGESQGNQDPMIYATVPDHAIGLTERGREQAQLCGEELRKVIGPDETITCFVSPFRRSKETCELICRAFTGGKLIKVREDPRIREQEWGNFQDSATRETIVLERRKIGRFFYRFKDGESGADVYDRVTSFMDSLYREMESPLMPNNNILIVTHGLFMRLFLTRFFRWSVEKFHTLENFQNCEYCVLQRNHDDGKFSLTIKPNTFPTSKPIAVHHGEDKYNEKSFHAEVHPAITLEDIQPSETENT